MNIKTDCSLFLQKDVQEKEFIPISKTFGISQKSSPKKKYIPAVAISISKKNHIQDELEDHYTNELTKTNHVRKFFCLKY